MKQFIIVLTTLFSLFAVGCSAKRSETTQRLTLGRNFTSSVLNPMYFSAKAHDYFADYDLTVNVSAVDNSTDVESLGARKIDALYYGFIKQIVSAAGGADIKIYAGNLSGGMAVVAHKSVADDVRNPVNWKGRNIGVSLYGQSDMVAKNLVINQMHWDYEKDVSFKYFNDQEALISNVAKHSLDIGIIGPSYVENAKSQGLVYLYPAVNLYPEYVCCRQSANAASLAENREAFVSFLKAQIRGYKDYVTDEKSTTAIIAKEIQQDESFVTWNVYDPATNEGTTYNPDPNFNNSVPFYDIMLLSGYVTAENPVPIEHIYDISLYADALQSVIAQFPSDPFYKAMWDYFVSHNDAYPGFYEAYPAHL